MEPLDLGLGYQAHQVPVSDVVTGQEHQVVGTAFGALLVKAAAVGHVDFAADDGFDAGLCLQAE